MHPKTPRKNIYHVGEINIFQNTLSHVSLCMQPLSNLIKRRSLSVNLFADDIQILNSIFPKHVLSAISSVETCISDVENLMIEDTLQLNDEKGNAFLYVQINAHKI